MIYLPRGMLVRMFIHHPSKGYRVWRAWRAYKRDTTTRERGGRMAIIRSFTCPMCGHKFFTQRALAVHLRSHGK